MAKSIQQAEAELRAAALEYSAKNREYSRACDVEPDFFKYEDGKRIFDAEKATPEWRAAVNADCDAYRALATAALALDVAVAAERRAEAL